MRFRVELLYLLALLLSVMLVIWQQVGMNREWALPISSQTAVSAFGDSVNGGRSILQATADESQLNLSCQIVLSGTFPFCSMMIPLTDSAINGLNLSHFDELILDLDYQSSARDTLLVYLINHEVIDRVSVDRANMVTLVPVAGASRYNIKLDRFQVPSWWVFSQTKPVTSEVALDNVIKLQISSGDNNRPRVLNIAVTGIRLHGKWLQAEDLYAALLALWLSIAVLHLLFSGVRLRRKNRRDRQQARELERINAFLEIERVKLEKMARYDALTGCLNRHGLSEVLQQLLGHSGRPVAHAVILFDVDHFKQINDQFGHDEGDLVLKSIAGLVRQTIRPTDHLIRWGGEEFMLLCEQTPLAGAISVAENLRQRIAETTLSQQKGVTASFGVATLDAHSFDKSIQQADTQLYRAKAEGRNCVRPSLSR